MIILSKNQKLFIALLIIAIAFLFSVKKTKIYKLQSKVNVEKFVDKSSQDVFSTSENFEKIYMYYKTLNIEDFRKEIDKIINEMPVNVEINNLTSSKYILLLEFPKEKEREIIGKFNEIPDKIEETKNVKKSSINVNFINEHVLNYKFTLSEMKTRLKEGDLSPSYMEKMHNQIVGIQAKIDSLKNVPKVYKHNKENTLLYVTANLKIQNEKSLGSKLKEFVIYFAISLVVVIFFFIVMYYLMNVIIALMEKIGIKTEKKSSRYNHYSRKNRIKRKYINKEKKDK